MDHTFQKRLRLTILAAGITLTVSAACLAWGGVRGNGKFVDQERTVEAFHGVEIESGIQLELKVGPAAPIQIHAEENIVPLVETEVHGGILRVRFERNSSHSDDGVTVKITSPRIDRVEASGGAGASGEVANSESLDVDASGGGEIHLRGVEAKMVSANASGGATVELQGKADELQLEASGGARFPLEKLEARTVRVDASGGSEGRIHASDTVRGEISGGTDLRVAGGAKTHVSSSGGSSLDVD